MNDASFAVGSLRARSFARPGKLFTANRDVVMARVGALKMDMFRQIVEAVIAILRASIEQ
jgi:mRNA interferase MazF